MSTLTKADLVAAVAAETGETKAATLRVLTAIQDQIMAAVAEGKSVTLTGFVAFDSHDLKPRVIMNPQTGEPMNIPGRRKVRIRPLGQFNETVQNGLDADNA